MLAGGVIQKGGEARGYKSGCVREKCCFKSMSVIDLCGWSKASGNQVYDEFITKCPVLRVILINNAGTCPDRLVDRGSLGEC